MALFDRLFIASLFHFFIRDFVIFTVFVYVSNISQIEAGMQGCKKNPARVCDLADFTTTQCEHKTIPGKYVNWFGTNHLFWNNAKWSTCESTLTMYYLHFRGSVNVLMQNPSMSSLKSCQEDSSSPPFHMLIWKSIRQGEQHQFNVQSRYQFSTVTTLGWCWEHESMACFFGQMQLRFY